MKKYILFIFLVLLSVTRHLSAYCVYNYTDNNISVRDSQSGHGRMGWHNVNPNGDSTCCAGGSTGCHPDKHIKNIYIEAKNSQQSFTCDINVPAHGDIYILRDTNSHLYCNSNADMSQCCSNYCCMSADDCSNTGTACAICQGNCESCIIAGECGWAEKRKTNRKPI